MTTSGVGSAVTAVVVTTLVEVDVVVEVVVMVEVEVVVVVGHASQVTGHAIAKMGPNVSYQTATIARARACVGVRRAWGAARSNVGQTGELQQWKRMQAAMAEMPR